MAPNPQISEAVLVETRFDACFDSDAKTDVFEDVFIEEDEMRVRLSEELEHVARTELGETPEVRAKALCSVRAWLRSEGHECRTDRLFLLRFLRAQKFDVAKACAMIDGYLALKRDKPEWFTNLDPNDEQDYIKLIEDGFVCVLPGRESDSGRRVLLNRAARFDPYAGSAVSQRLIMRALVASAETLLEDEANQILGLTYIIDCQNMALRHCSIWSPADACLLFGRCERSFPMRHRDICLLRLPFVLRAVLEAVKTLLTPKMRKRLRMGHAKALDKSFVGVDLPHDLPSDNNVHPDLLNRKWADAVRANANLLKTPF